MNGLPAPGTIRAVCALMAARRRTQGLCATLARLQLFFNFFPKRLMKKTASLLAALALALPLTAALAQEADLRKTLGQRLPSLSNIDEVSKTPMQGVYEIRVGNDILYADAKGDFVLQGNLIDTRARKNLTEERIEKLTAIQFDALPLKNAIKQVRGKGERKVAIFEDPNCHYCHKLEHEIADLDNVTIYTFLIPILGQGSVEKAKNIWCAKDPLKTWHAWMQKQVEPAAAECDQAAIAANLEFARANRITGTPTIVFANGARVPGAIPGSRMDEMLNAAK